MMMANCKVEMNNCDAKTIAAELRKTADGFDPWTTFRGHAIAFIFGAIFVAAMDYGDVWLCVGQCNQNTTQGHTP